MATVLFTSNNYSSGTAKFTPSDSNFTLIDLGSITFPYTFDPTQFGLPDHVIEGNYEFTTGGCIFNKNVARLATTTLATTQATMATAATTQATMGTAATTQPTMATAATTQATMATSATTQPTAATTQATTVAPVDDAEVYYFHLGAEGYPYAQDLINGQLFKSDDSIATEYSESFEDMLENPGKYEPVGTVPALVDKTTFTMPASVTSNFYWIAVPVKAGVPDLTEVKSLEIDGAPADIAKAKLNFTRKNGEDYILYQLNTVPLSKEADIKYVNS